MRRDGLPTVRNSRAPVKRAEPSLCSYQRCNRHACFQRVTRQEVTTSTDRRHEQQVLIQMSSQRGPQTKNSLRIDTLICFSSTSNGAAHFIRKYQLSRFNVHAVHVPLQPSRPRLRISRPCILLAPACNKKAVNGTIPIRIGQFLGSRHGHDNVVKIVTSNGAGFNRTCNVTNSVVTTGYHIPLLCQFRLVNASRSATAIHRKLHEFFSRCARRRRQWPYRGVR